jgi:outer membrane protein assembly factor BamB
VSDLPLVFPDQLRVDQAETANGGACNVMWTRALGTSGGIAHPALGKTGNVHIASGEKLYALDSGATGALIWTWPDDDAGGMAAPVGEVFTPVIGKEGALYMGHAVHAGEGDEEADDCALLAVDKNGHGRFRLPLDGCVTGAPAITSEERILVLTDRGALYHVKDIGATSYAVWKHEGAEALNNPLAGAQPVVGPAALFGAERMLALSVDALHCLDAKSGDPVWTFPLPAGYQATSNAIMDFDGNVWFIAGQGPVGEYFAQSYLFKVGTDGKEAETSSTKVYGSPTRVVSLSQGNVGTLLLGTRNAGVISASADTGEMYWHYFPAEQNFETVAQPVQAADGLVYFAAERHWLYVIAVDGTYLWHVKLDNPNEVMGAALSPSSPILLPDGAAIFHGGHHVYAVQCTQGGPSTLAWPRFGANDRNTANIADKLLENR